MVESKPWQVVITATPPTRDVSKEPVTLRSTIWTSNEAQLELLNDITSVQVVRHIALPFLAPSILLVTIITIIGSLNIFDHSCG
ncbi:MAG: hypothetical protein AB1817_01765 [Chloroflexota bacterium]